MANHARWTLPGRLARGGRALLCAGVLLGGCRGPGPGPETAGPRPADAGADLGRADAGTAADFLGEPPELLARAAALAVDEGDLPTARRLLELALAAQARTAGQTAGGPELEVQPVAGLSALSEAPGQGQEREQEQGQALAALATRAQRALVGRGTLVSLVELAPGPSGRLAVRRLPATQAAVTALALSGRAERAAVRDADGTLRLIATATGQVLAEHGRSQRAGPGTPSDGPRRRYQGPALDFSPDGQLLIAADCLDAERQPACLRVFGAADGRERALLVAPGPAAPLLDFTVRTDNVLVALWAGAAPQFYLTGGEGKAPDAGADGAADAALQAACAQAAPLAQAGRFWAVAPDRDHVAVPAADGRICVFDTAARRPLRAIPVRRGLGGLRPGDAVTPVALLDDARGIVVETRDAVTPHAALLDGGGRALAQLGRLVSAMPLDDDGLLLMGAATVRRRAQLGRIGPDLRVTQRLVAALPALPIEAASGDGRHLLLSALDDGRAMLVTPSARTPLGTGTELCAADFLDDGRALVTVDGAARLRVFEVPGGAAPGGEVPGGALRASLRESPGPVRAVHFSADGPELTLTVAHARPGTLEPARRIAIWLGAGRVVPARAATAAEARATAEARAPDGRLLARGNADGAVTILRATDRAPLVRLWFLARAGEDAAPAAVLRIEAGPRRGHFAVLAGAAGAADLDVGEAVACRAGTLVLPAVLCAEPARLGGTAGELLREALALAPMGVPAPPPPQR